MTKDLKEVILWLRDYSGEPDYKETREDTLITFCMERAFILDEQDWKYIDSQIKNANSLTELRERFDKDYSHPEIIWNALCEIPFNEETNEIKEFFRGYPAGTDRFEIWGDMEENFGINIKRDFLGIDDDEEKEKTKVKATNNRDLTPDMLNEESRFMVSSGSYLNYWDINGDYDVFLCFHDLEVSTHEEMCELVVQQIMEHRHVNDTKEELAKRIKTVLENLIEWEYCEPVVFVLSMKEAK